MDACYIFNLDDFLKSFSNYDNFVNLYEISSLFLLIE